MFGLKTNHLATLFKSTTCNWKTNAGHQFARVGLSSVRFPGIRSTRKIWAEKNGFAFSDALG
jgi:hypothetical protein